MSNSNYLNYKINNKYPTFFQTPFLERGGIQMNYLANGKENAHVPKMPPEPGNPIESLNWLIHLQHIRGEITACKGLIQKEIRKSGGFNEYAFFKQGIILREEGRIQEALESFQTCLKLNPRNVDNVKEVGECLYKMRRFRLSLDAYLEAERLSKNPDWQIHFSIGQCLMHLGDIKKAKIYTQNAVEFGKDEEAYTLLMKILILEGDLQSAALVSSAAVESCPDNVSMLTESGLLYLKIGETQQAFDKFNSALALDPYCAKALLGIGCITQSYEEHDTALIKYKLAIQKEPNSVALWNNIGVCFYAKQKFIAAISCLKRALWIFPMNWRILFNLGLVHLATNQPASAFNFLCAAVNLRPKAHSFSVLGYALMELKDMENSVRANKQALLLAPKDPLIILNCLICLIVAKEYDEAKDLFRKLQLLLEQNITASKEVKEMGEFLLASEFGTSMKQENTLLLNAVENANKNENEEEDINNLSQQKRELEPDEV